MLKSKLLEQAHNAIRAEHCSMRAGEKRCPLHKGESEACKSSPHFATERKVYGGHWMDLLQAMATGDRYVVFAGFAA